MLEHDPEKLQTFRIWGDIARREVFIIATLIFSAGLIIITTKHFRKRPV